MKIVDISITQGETFSRKCVYVDGAGNRIDVSDSQLRGQIRERKNRYSPLIASFTFKDLNLANGEWTMEIRDTTNVNRPGYWDIELEDSNGVVTRPMGGRVKVDTEVTK